MSDGAFQAAWRRLVAVEAGYVDDPSDSGGKTRYGVTEALARSHGYFGDMRDLPLETAELIARLEFWDALGLDSISEISRPVAGELLDTAYNTGTRRAGRFLQRALNGLNRRQADFPDLVVDGVLGRKSRRALLEFFDVRGLEGELVLLRLLDAQQGAFYLRLVERREKDERFLYGWVLERLENESPTERR